jgi:autotransporter adhesin
VGTTATGGQRQIINVAAGTATTDAVNLGQLTAATVAVQATASTALATADTALSESTAQVNILAHSAGANATTQDAGDAATLVAANAHSAAGDATTLAAANSFTSTSSAATFTSANAFATQAVGVLQDDFDTFQSDVNNEFATEDRRISRIGAMGIASSDMAMDTAGLGGTDRIGVGAGFQNGQSAFAVGYQHAFNNNRANVSLSGSFSNGDSGVGVGAGFSW